MRHVADTLVWLGLIMMVAAIIYLTPRVSDYVASLGLDSGKDASVYREVALQYHLGASAPSR
jgi:hypothetical protein